MKSLLSSRNLAPNLAETIATAKEGPIDIPPSGNLLARTGRPVRRLAQSGYGSALPLIRPPGHGGNCYACHQLTKGLGGR